MAVTITEFRRNLFPLIEAALRGQAVEFMHKGVKFKVVPEIEDDPLANLTPLQVINPSNPDLGSAREELLREMQQEWEKDWENL